jgi:AraC family transcriptional regulator
MDKRIEKAYDIIKRKFKGKLLLKEIADQVGLSPFHFQRLFKEEMGETPATCLSRIRLERAAHFLIAGAEMPLSTLAEDCGFSSLSAFSRAFSQRYGMSPMAFAKSDSVRAKIDFYHEEIQVDIVYHPGAHVLYNQTALLTGDILKECEEAENFCRKEGIKTAGKKIGIITYLAFHYPHDKLNYYAGVEIAKQGKLDWADKIFQIPEGKYACISTQGSIQKCREMLMIFKRDWMDKKGYAMRDLFSFDEFDPMVTAADYPLLKRKIYVPIKKI